VKEYREDASNGRNALGRRRTGEGVNQKKAEDKSERRGSRKNKTGNEELTDQAINRPSVPEPPKARGQATFLPVAEDGAAAGRRIEGNSTRVGKEPGKGKKVRTTKAKGNAMAIIRGQRNQLQRDSQSATGNCCNVPAGGVV